MATRWPKEVPVLSARDIVQGPAIGTGGERCLVNWAYKTFRGWTSDKYASVAPPKVWDAIDSAALELCGVRLGVNVANFNDDPKRSKRLLARTWNRAMAKLGYTQKNPEAKYVK